MTLYEKHIGRLTTKADLLAERDWYVSRVLSKEQMERRSRLVKVKNPVQLSLFEKAPN